MQRTITITLDRTLPEYLGISAGDQASIVLEARWLTKDPRTQHTGFYTGQASVKGSNELLLTLLPPHLADKTTKQEYVFRLAVRPGTSTVLYISLTRPEQLNKPCHWNATFSVAQSERFCSAHLSPCRALVCADALDYVVDIRTNSITVEEPIVADAMPDNVPRAVVIVPAPIGEMITLAVLEPLSPLPQASYSPILAMQAGAESDTEEDPKAKQAKFILDAQETPDFMTCYEQENTEPNADILE